MLILGVDPGIVNTGYAILNIENKAPRLVDYGCIQTKQTALFPFRLKTIYDGVTQVIERFKPDTIALEEVIYSKNVQIALKMGHARGVTLLAAVNKGISTAEYSPREIKLAITGNGAASKSQVQRMVYQLLNLHELSASYDITDAMAVAICHGYRSKRGSKIEGND